MVRLYTLRSFVFKQSNFKLSTSWWMKLSIQFSGKVITFYVEKNLFSFPFLKSKNMGINWTRRNIIPSMCSRSLVVVSSSSRDGENQTEVIFVRNEEEEKNGYVKNLRLFGLYANGIFWGFFEVSISHKNQASSSSGEFFCTIWLIRQLTNEGWFVSLLPENVSIFRPSFFSISSPSKMSLTSRPNICYYYLWTLNKERSSHYYIWEVENSVKNYKGMYYLQFILCIDLKTKSGGTTYMHYFALRRFFECRFEKT